ncbi:MAG: DUF4184 family protein [Planctomycetota bacterium]
MDVASQDTIGSYCDRMPFTPTHIAAAVPIRYVFGSAVPFSALAIGCMTPDLGVFFPKLFPYDALHSLRGLLTHCVPAGLAAYYVFHIVLRAPLVELFPARFAVPLRPIARNEVDLGLKAICIATLCVLLGSASHVFWDTFTHHSRWGVRTFPWLREQVFQSDVLSVPWYRILQHGSSVVLLPPLAWWAYQNLTRLGLSANLPGADIDSMEGVSVSDGDPGCSPGILSEQLDSKPGVSFRVVGFVVMSLIVMSGMFFVFGRIAHPGWRLEAVVRLSIQNTGAVATVLVLVYCLVWQWLALEREPEEQQPITSKES